MKVKQAVKHFTLLSMIAVGISGCSSTQEIEEQEESIPAVIEEPVTLVHTGAVKEKPNDPVSTNTMTKNSMVNNGMIKIPVLDDAQIFAEFTDSLPAVVNYFTQSNESEVIDFYQQAFGEAVSQERKLISPERKLGRLTLQYVNGEEAMRVVISEQGKKHQVDIIVVDSM
jgi:hypothetical protein